MAKIRYCIAAALAIAALSATGAQTKLTVWYAVSGDSGEAFKEMLEAYDAATPDVTIEYSYSGSYADTATKVSAAIASKTAPDLALMAAGPLYTGGLNDFYIETKLGDPGFAKDDIFRGVWDYAKFNDRICAVPYGISTPVMYYNKAVIEKAGIDLSVPPRSWDDLLRLAKAAQANGNVTGTPDFWGFDVTDVPWLFKTMLAQNGNGIISVNGSKVRPAFADEKAVEVAAFWKRLVDEKVMPVGQHSNAEKKFLAGNVAFLVASSTRVAKWAKDSSLRIGAIKMPYFKKATVAMGGNVLVILGKNQKNRDEAWKLVKYLASAENQTAYALRTGYLPIRKSGVSLKSAKDAVAANAMYGIAFDQLDESWSYWHFDQMGTMDSIIAKAIDSMERGVQGPQATLQKAAQELQKEIDG